MAIAGLIADGPVTVTDSECVNITYPGFFESLRDLGADVETG